MIEALSEIGIVRNFLYLMYSVISMYFSISVIDRTTERQIGTLVQTLRGGGQGLQRLSSQLCGLSMSRTQRNKKFIKLRSRITDFIVDYQLYLWARD